MPRPTPQVIGHLPHSIRQQEPYDRVIHGILTGKVCLKPRYSWEKDPYMPSVRTLRTWESYQALTRAPCSQKREDASSIPPPSPRVHAHNTHRWEEFLQKSPSWSWKIFLLPTKAVFVYGSLWMNQGSKINYIWYKQMSDSFFPFYCCFRNAFLFQKCSLRAVFASDFDRFALYSEHTLGGASAKDPHLPVQETWDTGFNPWVGMMSWRRAWKPTPVFLPGKSRT